ncbi:hypothetical protein CISG_00965 [Coccidioides immitis RMSCC 3703]|uniref:SCP domain-containing protein n=1 Tax=Coccidioides immitis RMSCC 3703 TaxID=454286 RepID=A0A0J8QR95_COCIT|nr:hypothetical protein CISG_00965 [Coccidioides immitis RMSCC 3703]
MTTWRAVLNSSPTLVSMSTIRKNKLVSQVYNARLILTASYSKYNGGGYGQNIGYQGGFSNIGAMLSNAMYNGEAPKFDGLYGQANPGGNFHEWGHFTQIVWKGTKKVACYTKRCPTLRVGATGSTVNNADFIVCNYGPPGNYAGEYDKNVGKPLGHPTVTA